MNTHHMLNVYTQLNVIFLMFALHTLWQFKRGHQKEDEKHASQKLVR